MKPMTATEVNIRQEQYRMELRVRSIRMNKMVDSCFKLLRKRTLITMSNYGPITSMVCVKIKVIS